MQKICVGGIVDYPNGVWTCYGGSEQIAVLHAVTLNPGREGVPFPGRYAISIDCAKLHHKVPSLIVQPRDCDIVDEQTGRWLENPWDWVVYDQSGLDPSGVITPRQYGKSPGLMVFCHDWTITFTEVAQG